MNTKSLDVSRTRTRIAASLCLALGLALGACSSDSSSDSAAAVSMKTDSTAGTSDLSSSSSSSTSSSAAAQTTMDDDAAPEGDFNSSSSEAAPSDGAYLGIEDVRVGSHDGYDRIVFELMGEGTPGYFVRYEDVPTQQGSGKPISVDGTAKLVIDLRGMGYPFDFQMEDFPSDPVKPTSTSVIKEVVGGGTFEGQTQYVVGLKGDKTPFKVFSLSNPNRLVIDFQSK
ncbi:MULTISPECIES: hypothetical protein [unclassified Corynebacterium]|uniref:AMIN-like domain-containing (lipo)protein n=1 Tax=Corynebacterium TaxID=1716 RepID=UPI00034E7A95|nr:MULTISPECIES: hypothetical protein [Corynebacterium]MDU4703740.1 hypothetical protein [Corynebacterium sp.]EPD47990.1 hypothetical protein HMPREF1206_00859 [Corynebacterium sp. HFH0082]MBC6748101.1 hypothetical protein [Corynebacterium sp. LK25]MDK8506357.1 hypothetical protein [Corynebacterium amycolatum]TXS59754.1 hypothetical protein CHU67_04995 [Corynebacterium sp. LK19]